MSTLSSDRLKKLELLKRRDPAAWREMVELIFEIDRRELKQRYQDSFLEFVKRAWPEIDPAPLRLAWFHEVIIEYLEAVADGNLRSLIINCPPRTGKSLLVSVMYPAWCWCRSEIAPQSGPQVSFFCVSYSATLAEELAVKMRRLVFGAWYQGVFGNVKMLPDQSSRANFGNTAGGLRISSSIESGLLGRGGDCHLYDDLMTVKEAESDLERLSILRAFSEGLPTRITNPLSSARILVGQRVSEDDPTNLALETWTDAIHLMFPARYEPDRCCPQDQRTYEGELLWPEVWPEAELRKVELGLAGLEKGQAGLSSYAAAAQLQQAPVPRGGGVIPRTDWKVWPERTPDAKDIRRAKTGEFIVELPDVSFVLVAVDTAFSEKDTADFSAVVVLGVWSRKREEVSTTSPWFGSRWTPNDTDQLASRAASGEEQPRVILMEAWQTRAGLNVTTPDPRTGKPAGLIPRLLDTCRRRHADRIIIENANRGHDTAQELERQMRSHEFIIEMFEPAKHGSKLNRMFSVSPLFSQGLVSAPANLTRDTDKFGRDTVRVGEFQWVNAVLDQCVRTPRGKQDLADCVSMGLIYLRQFGFLELQVEFIKSELERQSWKPKLPNIPKEYGVV
jgi:hypothetical protein